MGNNEEVKNDGKVPFETALDMAGFGLYSYLLTSLTALIIISYVTIAYGSNIIVPTSACELGTTNAQQGYLAAGPLIGIILGGVINGHLGDKFGRRRILFYVLVLAAIINGLASISVNWVMLLLLQSLASICAAGQYSLALTILSESVPMRRRNLVVLLVTSLILVAQGIMAVVAIPLIPLPFSIYLPALGIYWNSWRTLLLIVSLPSLLAAFLLFFMKESPKYVFAQGREEEAIDIIKYIHRINHGKSARPLEIKSLKLETWQLNGPPSRKDQIIPLFKVPLVKYTFIVTALFVLQPLGAFAIWMPTIVNQFVEIIETGVGSDKSLCGIINSGLEAEVDPDIAPCALNTLTLLIVAVVGVIQAVANITLSFVVDRVGRRNMTIGVVVICGLSGMIVNVVPNAYASVVFFIIFQIGILVNGLYAAIAVALFPTHLRALAVAFTMAIGQIGSFASVQILNLLLSVNCDAGFYTFSAIFGSSAIIAAFLPDDRHLPKAEKKISEENGVTNE